MNRYLSPLRPNFLACCICLLVVWPHSLPAQGAKKTFGDAIIRFLRKQIRLMDEKIANRTERSTSPEAMRSKKVNEAILRMEAHPEIKDETFVIWDIADDAMKKRAQMEVSELERGLKEEADRIADEEKLSEECQEIVASMLKKTVCFGVKEKLTNGSWPIDEVSDKFVTGAFGATMECVFLGFAHRISRGAKTRAAEALLPATKAVAKALGKMEPSPEAKSSDEMNEGAVFGLVYLMCKDE